MGKSQEVRAAGRPEPLAPRSFATACADDISIVLGCLSRLDCLVPPFVALRGAAGLELNVAKCNLVPLAAAFSEELRAHTRQQIARVAPFWGSTQVVPSATLLGVALGPAVSETELWQKPLRKLYEVQRLVLSAGLAVPASAWLLRTHALSVLQ